jgi:hypothetical protein
VVDAMTVIEKQTSDEAQQPNVDTTHLVIVGSGEQYYCAHLSASDAVQH